LQHIVGSTLAVTGIVLALLDIPFGDGILAYLAVSSAACMAEEIIVMAPTSSILPAYDVKNVAVGLGLLSILIWAWRRYKRSPYVLLTAAGYISAFGIDALALSWQVSLYIAALLQMDRLIEVAMQTANSIVSVMASVVVAAIPIPGLPSAYLVTLATLAILIARFIQMVFCNLMVSISGIVAGIGRPSILAFLSIPIALATSIIPAFAWALTIVVVAAAVMLMVVVGLARTGLGIALELLAAILSSVSLGFLLGGIGKAIRRAGGRSMAVADAVLGISAAVAVATIAYAPLLAVALAVWGLVAVLAIVRLLMGIPRRRLTSYMQNIFGLALFHVGLKMQQEAINTAIGYLVEAYNMLKKILPLP